jgi:hypothetical protein
MITLGRCVELIGCVISVYHHIFDNGFLMFSAVKYILNHLRNIHCFVVLKYLKLMKMLLTRYYIKGFSIHFAAFIELIKLMN